MPKGDPFALKPLQKNIEAREFGVQAAKDKLYPSIIGTGQLLIASDALWEMESSVDGTSCRKRLTDLVREQRHEKADTIAKAVKKQIEICCDAQAAKDDITLVVVKFDKGSKSG